MVWSLDLHTLFTGDEIAPTEDARATRADLMTLLMIGTAAALLGACELIFLRDIFSGGPYGALGQAFRMNTVFKFYYQVWLLLGIVSGPALVWIVGRMRSVARDLWQATRPAIVAATGDESAEATAATPALASVSSGRQRLDLHAARCRGQRDGAWRERRGRRRSAPHTRRHRRGRMGLGA